KAQSCGACHTDADGQMPKGPHLVDIGKRYSAAELLESILRPSAKIAQGFETYFFELADGRAYTGFVVSESARAVLIREATGVQRELQRAQIASRTIQKQSMMPDGLVNNLTPEELADLIAYLQSLTGGDAAPKNGGPRDGAWSLWVGIATRTGLAGIGIRPHGPTAGYGAGALGRLFASRKRLRHCGLGTGTRQPASRPHPWTRRRASLRQGADCPSK